MNGCAGEMGRNAAQPDYGLSPRKWNRAIDTGTKTGTIVAIEPFAPASGLPPGGRFAFKKGVTKMDKSRRGLFGCLMGLPVAAAVTAASLAQPRQDRIEIGDYEIKQEGESLHVKRMGNQYSALIISKQD